MRGATAAPSTNQPTNQQTNPLTAIANWMRHKAHFAPGGQVYKRLSRGLHIVYGRADRVKERRA